MWWTFIQHGDLSNTHTDLTNQIRNWPGKMVFDQRIRYQHCAVNGRKHDLTRLDCFCLVINHKEFINYDPDFTVISTVHSAQFPSEFPDQQGTQEATPQHHRLLRPSKLLLSIASPRRSATGTALWWRTSTKCPVSNCWALWLCGSSEQYATYYGLSVKIFGDVLC